MTESKIEKQMTPLEMYESRPQNLWKRILIFVILVIAVVWSAGGVQFNGIAAKGSEVAGGIVYGLIHPDTTLLFDMSTEGVLFLTAQTVAIAILGTIFGAILAVPVSFLASKNITNKVVAFIFRALILMIRTIPSLVWALVWIRVTGPNAFCGVVTQSICSIGMISKMYITAIEDLDTGV